MDLTNKNAITVLANKWLVSYGNLMLSRKEKRREEGGGQWREEAEKAGADGQEESEGTRHGQCIIKYNRLARPFQLNNLDN